MDNFTIIETEQIEPLFPGASSTDKDDWRVKQIPRSLSADAGLINELKINLLTLKEASIYADIIGVHVLERNHEHNATWKIDPLMSFC